MVNDRGLWALQHHNAKVADQLCALETWHSMIADVLRCRGGGGDMFTAAAIVYTLGSVTVPSLASVYNEFALKKHMETSVHEQNFFLYFYGAVFNLLGVFGVMAFSHLSWNAIFLGHSKVRHSLSYATSQASLLGAQEQSGPCMPCQKPHDAAAYYSHSKGLTMLCCMSSSLIKLSAHAPAALCHANCI